MVLRSARLGPWPRPKLLTPVEGVALAIENEVVVSALASSELDGLVGGDMFDRHWESLGL